MKTISTMLISASITACLLSGVQVLHDVAFAISVFTVVLTCVLLPFVVFGTAEAFRKGLSGLLPKIPFTLAFWFALGYTNHTYLLAASIVCFAVYVSFALFKIKQEGVKP